MQDLPDGKEIQALFDSFSEGIVFTDAQGIIRWMNPMAAYLLGLETGLWVGNGVDDLSAAHPQLAWVFEDTPEQHLRCWETMECQDPSCPLWGQPVTDCWSDKNCPHCGASNAQNGGVNPTQEGCPVCQIYKSYSPEREGEIRRANREKVLLQVHNIWIRSPQGDVVGMLRLLRNVTHDRELARMKGEFLSILSHDLRSPLTSIRSYTEILLNYEDTDLETRREFLNIIHQESQRLDKMIEDLVIRERSGAGRPALNREEVRLSEMVEELLEDRKEMLLARQLTCTADLDPALPTVLVEADKLYHVFGSLLQSIVDLTPAGGRIWLRAFPLEGQRETDRNALLCFTLTNDPTLSQKPVPSRESPDPSGTFSPRRVMARTRATDLGFLVCKKVLDQCGGNLWMEKGASESGYAFHCVLPPPSPSGTGAVPDASRRKEQGPKPSRPKIEKSEKRILIVDDEPNQVNALRIGLSREGYDVHATTSAHRALEMVHEVKPDLIISDIGMPEMDGFTLFQHLRNEESTKMIPFIFLTAKSGDEDLVKGLKVGVDDYLTKPYQITQVALRVEILLQRLEEYTDLSRFDGLTGALTRKAFEESLLLELQKAQQAEGPLALAMADLDEFKKVNDTFGHLAGDFVLSSFVNFLRDNLRDEDILARYGGEEFCLIMPGVGKQTALEILERVRRMLSETAFYYEKDELHLRITCSFGVSGFPEDGDQPEGLIEKSDTAMYEAKSLGRNRVVRFEAEMMSRAPKRASTATPLP